MENNDITAEKKKFYITAKTFGIDGIGAIVFPIISSIIYAVENGCIPIVDLKHYYNQYFKDGRAFKDNAWEYYFEQPFGYTLDDIKEEDEVVITSSDNIVEYSYIFTTKHLSRILGKRTKANLRERILRFKNESKKYLRFNQQTQEYLDKICEEKFKGEKNVLGVLCRGTDYIERKPINEPKQPKPQRVIKDVKKLIKERGYKKIYLATEDAKIYEMFKKEFGDKLIENTQYMYKNYDKDKFLYEIEVKRENHNYLLGLEYLASLYVLSKCKGFIGGPTSGSKMAYILADDFDYFHMYFDGLYRPYNHFWERLFSIKENRYRTKKECVLTILGIRIRIN